MRKEIAFANLKESRVLECKLANGKNGKGALPIDFWESYSAMANSSGGLVLLGVREKNGVFTPEGIEDIERVKTDLFNTLNNPQKVSCNLLNDNDVYAEEVDGKNILFIEIPQANRKQRPIYINNNPLTGTYIRLHEGDRKCTSEQVKSMLAEQTTDTLDDRIFEGYTIDDLDKASIQIYRKMLADSKPSHVWLELDDFDFITALKGWKKDRKTKIEGLTLAGILMFGKWSTIQEALPNYFIEYQEITQDNRWDDRLFPDGSWTGNLFEFYRKVYRKLIEDLKIPFQINQGIRKDDSPVHVALREALVNSLVHADYNGHSPIKITKQNGLFSFRNPGTMRVPISIAKVGGESDCRNKFLHQMFLMIGLGERAGSGLPKIISGWRSQHWSEPKLIENFEINNTILELGTNDFIPEETISTIRGICGDKFDTLTKLDRIILATAADENIVSHERIKSLTMETTRSITLSLSKLVRLKFLNSDGVQKHKRYFLPTYSPIRPDDAKGHQLLQLAFIHPPKDIAFTVSSNNEAPLYDFNEELDEYFTRKDAYKYIVQISILATELQSATKTLSKRLFIAKKLLNQNNKEQKNKDNSEFFYNVVSESLDEYNDSPQRLGQKQHLSTEQQQHLSTEQQQHLSTEQQQHLSTKRQQQLSTEQQQHLSTEQQQHLSTEQQQHLSTKRQQHLSTEQHQHPSTSVSIKQPIQRVETPYQEKRHKEILKEIGLNTDLLSMNESDLLSEINELESSLATADDTYRNMLCNENGRPKTLYEMIKGKPFECEIDNPEDQVKTKADFLRLTQEIAWKELMDLSSDIREGSKRGVKKSTIMRVIVTIALRGYLTVRDFSELLGRNPNSLRRDYLAPLVKEKILTLAYPSTPTHAYQGYKSDISKLSIDLQKFDN
ncbi:RNA-binding domain-containing protein [Klebsiella aerogenes]|nr:putative DNA binding domain-containing protein [Klebsiella aerogenes]HDT3335538.1 putative DNA binding domain-containing protein [Klebsiella aerogenes]HDU4031767.1 putative DNA binding domain-containing protein [Klebsiella aerogenes]